MILYFLLYIFSLFFKLKDLQFIFCQLSSLSVIFYSQYFLGLKLSIKNLHALFSAFPGHCNYCQNQRIFMLEVMTTLTFDDYPCGHVSFCYFSFLFVITNITIY